MQFQLRLLSVLLGRRSYLKNIASAQNQNIKAMDNNKESILQQVNNSCKDILSFLAEKYGVSRPEVKQATLLYAYNEAIISNPDSLKFAEPNNPYQNLINDYIDYTKEFMEAKRNTISAKAKH